MGIQDTVEETVRVIGDYLEEGYARIKLKIKPGKDIAPVAAVRKAFGDDFGFQVDANAAYTLVDAAHLRRLDDYGLLLIEQPLGEADIRRALGRLQPLETTAGAPHAAPVGDFQQARAAFERELIAAALAQHQGNVVEAARALGARAALLAA